jgi:hypothetical protein
MNILSFCILSTWLNLGGFFHGEHYSVTNIDYFSDKDSIQIGLKINLDDMNLTLAHYSKTQEFKNCKNTGPEIDKLINDYISSTFKIKINQKKNPVLKYKKREILENDMWVYFSSPINGKIKNIEIMQALFFDIYTDQVNLIIFSENGKEAGYRTTFDNRKILINLNSKT